MESKPQLIGVFGGTFDPIHVGHLRLLIELIEQYPFQEIRIVPCHQNVLKSITQTTAEQRIAMLHIALADLSKISIDAQEINRVLPSYTFITLESIRAEVALDQPIALIMGSDAFMDFHLWHRWQEISPLAHIIVVTRGDFTLEIPDELKAFVAERETNDFQNLLENTSGKIMICSLPLFTISAKRIRARLATKHNVRYLVPDPVLQYIGEQKLYSG